MVFFEPRGSKYRDAGPDKVQGAVAGKDLAKYFPGEGQLETSALRSVQVKRLSGLNDRLGIGHEFSFL
jgi:hypothetical protein